MEMGWREALAGVAVVFLVFLLVKLRPVTAGRVALSADVRAARARAHAATTPRARAEAFCEAGALAMAQRARGTAAAGFFLRAMKADPTWPEAVQRAATALQKKRPRLLEKLLWRRLGHVPWDAEHLASLRAMGEALGSVYGGPIRDTARAEFFRRFVTHYLSAPAGKPNAMSLSPDRIG